MAVPSRYSIPEYPKIVNGKKVYNKHQEECALGNDEYPKHLGHKIVHSKEEEDAENKLTIEDDKAESGKLPSQEDLDKVAEEAAVKQKTAGNVFKHVGEEIKEGAEAVVEAVVDIALSGLGASQE